MKTRPPSAGTALALAILLGAASIAQAQPPVDAATKATARAAAEEGLKLFDQGSYLPALDRFNRAEELVHAQTMGLMAARCLEKLGRLVEASERYRATSHAAVDAGASDAIKSAVTSADKEYQALQARIPKIIVGLHGAQASEVEITIDGQPAPAAIVGIERLTNPGHHKVRAKRGADVAVREIDLKEGDSIDVALDLKAGDTPAGGDAPGSTQRAVGWAAIGLGAAGLVVGGVTLGLRLSARNTLVNNDGCTADLLCPNAVQGDVDHYNSLRAPPVAGFAIGGVGLVAGIVLLATAPKARPSGAGITLLPWVGPRSAGMTGVF